MALTYRAAIRLEAGDTGVLTRDTFSGTGSKTAYWLNTTPIDTATVTAYVADTAVSATPATNGRVVFASAPASGTDNIEIVYNTVILDDEKVDEILRQHGITTPTTVCDPTVEFLRAAAHLCDVIASQFAGAADVSIDGTDMKRSQMAQAYLARAQAIRQRIARETSSIGSLRIKRMDGYTVINDVTVDVASGSDVNPRRNYYGERDDLP